MSVIFSMALIDYVPWTALEETFSKSWHWMSYSTLVNLSEFVRPLTHNMVYDLVTCFSGGCFGSSSSLVGRADMPQVEHNPVGWRPNGITKKESAPNFVLGTWTEQHGLLLHLQTLTFDPKFHGCFHLNQRLLTKTLFSWNSTAQPSAWPLASRAKRQGRLSKSTQSSQVLVYV